VEVDALRLGIKLHVQRLVIEQAGGDGVEEDARAAPGPCLTRVTVDLPTARAGSNKREAALNF